jgi:hypothetical protein
LYHKFKCFDKDIHIFFNMQTKIKKIGTTLKKVIPTPTI